MVLRLLFLFLIVLAERLPAWESQLLPFNGGSGQYEEATVNFSGRDWRLLDFSYSGYKLGAQPLATGVPCTVFNVAGSGDITAALQTAINSAQVSGGIVRIPAGTFTLSAPLYITGSNVSIEGAGSNATFIQVPSSYTQSDPRYEGLFTFGKAAGGWNKGWIDRGTVLTDVTAVVPEGQMYVDVLDASAIAVNDWVMVRQYFWPGLSNPNSNNTWASYSGWPVPTTGGNRSFSFSYLRQVLSKAGNRLNLDAPIPWRLDPANNPIKVQQVPPTGGFAMKQNVGLSGMSISFADNYNDTSFSPARPAGAAVHFEGVRDGWIYDLVVRNFPRFAIQAESAARITVLDSAIYDCQDFGGDGYGYAYHWNESQQILVKRSYAEMVRHAYICQHPLTHLMVLTQNTSREARLGDDSHHSFVHGYLFDNHQSFEGSGARTTERGSTSTNAYETAGSSVFWNFQGDQGRGGSADGGAIFMNPSFDGWGMVIGGPGGAYKVFDGNSNAGDLISPAAGLQVGPTLQAASEGSKDRNALYEGIGQAGLSPASLYQTQLLRRLGSLPADFSSTCSAAFSQAPVVPSLYPGPETLVYNSDHLGWVPQLGSGCDPSSTAAGGTKTLQCWADSDGQNHSPGGAEAAWATVNGTDYSILMDFTGPSQARSAYSTLSFWAYSSVAGLQLRLYIAQRQDGNYTDSNAANTLVSIPVANTWTQVSVPMSTFGSPATLFNKVQFRSYSSNAGATVYIDDILLSGGATPTPTGSATRSPSATASRTASRTATATFTPTLSPTRTFSSSATPSATATGSVTGSPSRTATATASSTPSPTRTATRTPSRTASSTASPTATRTPDKPYSGGELRTNASYLYGRFETRMRAAGADGTVSSFFTFNDDAFSVPNWNEIDIEILGRYSDRVDFNVITYNQNMHNQDEQGVSPATDLCYHDYAIEWEPTAVRWFIDGVLVASDTGPHIAELTFPQKLMMNLWPPNIAAWSLILNAADLKQHAFYDYVSVYSYTPGSGSAGTGSNYSLLWRDDFNSWDGARWGKASHTFAENDARFDPANVEIIDGHMVLSLTLPDQQGYGLATVPPDCGSTPTATPSPSPSPSRTPGTLSLSGLLLYSSDAGGTHHLYRRDLASGISVQLTFGAFNDLNPQASPDGRFAVFYSDRDGDQEIWRLDLQDLSLLQLTFNSASDYDPAYSPDGSRIVFKSNRDDGLGDIFVMNADGSGQANRTPSRGAVEDWDPVFSPDGSQIYFVSRLTGGDPASDEIFVMQADGSGITRLTNNAVPDWYPAPSASDGRVAFVSKSAPASDDDLFVMDAAGGARTQLTTGGGDDGDPAWSADGLRLAYVNSGGGSYDLWLRNADGSAAQSLLASGSVELGPAWVLPLPPTATPTPTASQTPSATPSPAGSATSSPSPTPSPTAICPGGGFLGDAGITGVTNPAGFIDGNRYTLPFDGLLSAIQFYVGAGVGQARLAVYADATGAPGALLAESGPLTVQPGVNSAPFPMTPLPPATYWLFIQVEPGISIGYRPSGGQEYYQAYSFGAFPPTLSGGSFDSWTMGLLAVICPAPTPTPTPTFSESPVLSPTPTATESPVFSPTATPSATGTGTVTESPTWTATVTATLSASPTASSTESPSLTVSPSQTPMETATGTPSSTPLASASPSFTAIGSPSSTLTPTVTPTASSTPTTTRTVTGTVTLTATLSASPSVLPSASATPPATPSATPSPSPAASATASPAPAGPLQILDAVPFPQPNPRELRVKLAAPAQALAVRIYSPAMVLLQAFEVGPLPQGWSSVLLPTALPAGISFGELSARQGAQKSLPYKPLRLVRIP